MGNSPSKLPNHADIIKTAVYKAAAKKVKRVIRCKENSIDIPDVSDEIFQCLQSIDDWRKLLIDYDWDKEHLFVKSRGYPNCLLHAISYPMQANRCPPSHLPPAEAWGSADVHLYDRTTKSAGLSFYDPNMIPREDKDEHDLNAAFMNSCPTLVFEIALSQDARRLGSDCARWIGASKGAVKMAIATSIQNSLADDDIMETIKLSVWTLREFIENDETTEKQLCGFLRRTDGHSDEEDVSPLADEYLFSLRESEHKISTWRVGRTETEILKPDGQQLEGAIKILNRHVYRDTGSPACDEETYVDLQYAAMIEVIKRGHHREVSAKIVRETKMTEADFDEMIKDCQAQVARNKKRLSQKKQAQAIRQSKKDTS